MNLALIPKGVLAMIDLLRRSFFWGELEGSNTGQRKLHSICWDIICKSKQNGGLAVASLSHRIIVLMSKWLRKIKIERSSLFSRVLSGKYEEYLLESLFSPQQITLKNGFSFVKDLSKIPNQYRMKIWENSCFKWNVNNGETVKFWTDCWHGSSPLSCSYPHLFEVSNYRHASVKDRRFSGKVLIFWWFMEQSSNWFWTSRLCSPEHSSG